MYIKRLRSNVKGVFDVALLPRTLVVGPNASGKSGLVTALRLATTGRDSEIGAVGSELMTLAPAGAEELYATADTDTGGLLDLRVTGSTMKASKPAWHVEGIERPTVKGILIPPVALLDQEVRDLLKSEPKSLRRSLLKIAVGDVDVDGAIKEVLPTAFKEDWAQIWKQASSDAESVPDAIISAAEIIKGEIRQARVATRQAGERPEAPAKSEVEALASKVKAIKAQYNRLALLKQIESLQMEIDRIGASASGPTLDQIRAARERIAAAKVISAWARKAAEGHFGMACPGCGALESQWRLLDADDLAAINDKELREAEAAIPVRLGDLRREMDDLVFALPAEAEISQQDLDQREAYESLLVELRGKLARAEEHDQIAAAGRRAAVRLDALVALGRAVDRLVADTLLGGVAAFSATASKAAGGREVAIQLFDGKRSVCRLGLTGKHGDQIVPWKALSGAERATFLGAFASAWASRGVLPPIKILVADEVWLDQNHLARLCASLAASRLDQVIVCAVECRNEPVGWSVVRVGG